MKNKINNTTGMGVLMVLTAIAALGMVQQVRAGGGTFYATVTNETQLDADINYANISGGTFTINLQTNTTFDLTVGSVDAFNSEVMLQVGGVNLTILGNGDTIETGGEARLLDVGGSLTLDHVTLQNGYSFAHNGGAIYNSGTLLISHCTLSGNISFYDGYESDLLGGKGGAIYNDYGTVIISDSFLSGNYVYPEGGGGAIYNDYGTVTISNSTISGNYAEGGGGGIYNLGTLLISQSTNSGNSASDGGAIYNDSGTVTISHSTISGNTANYYVDDDGYGYGGYGGGIYNNGTETVENSSSIAGNVAAEFGPDVYNLGPLYLDGTSTIDVLDGSSAIGLPSLTLRQINSSSVTVSWPSPSTGFVLQQNTTDGLGSVNWSNVTDSIVDDGTNKTITQPMETSRFFRLVLP